METLVHLVQEVDYSFDVLPSSNLEHEAAQGESEVEEGVSVEAELLEPAFSTETLLDLNPDYSVD